MERKKAWWIAAAVFAADRAAKIAWQWIPAEGTVLIPGVVGLYPVRNTGMAFSLLSGRPWLLGVLSLLIVAGAACFLRGKKLSRGTTVGLMLMLGGAVGNMTDRFLTGFVPDMIEVLFVRFAVFNVADAALVIGCGVVMVAEMRGKRDAGEE